MDQENERLVSVEASIDIAASAEEARRRVVFEPLERQLTGTKRLPGVVSTELVNDVPLGKDGHRRLVRLADGNTAMEEHLSIEQEEGAAGDGYFSYKVWAYTLKAARGIKYGRGEWWFRPSEAGTRVRWRYSFKLDGRKFPGFLGAAGRALFGAAFAWTSYREYMESTLFILKADLENREHRSPRAKGEA